MFTGVTGLVADEHGVLIGKPSSAVKPIVLSTLRPPWMAHMDAPLPRCATITRPLAISGATFGRVFAMYS